MQTRRGEWLSLWPRRLQGTPGRGQGLGERGSVAGVRAAPTVPGRGHLGGSPRPRAGGGPLFALGPGRSGRFSRERIRVGPAAWSRQVPDVPSLGLALAMAARRESLGARLARRLAALGVRRGKRTPEEAGARDR